MRRLRIPVALLLASAMLAVPAIGQNWRPGATAPDWSGKASDGKTYSLASLRKTGKPTLLYFIGATCPVNALAVKYYVRAAAATKGKVNFVGVINADKAGYDQWQSRFKAPFPVVFDPKLQIIGKYKAERSPWTILVDKDGKIMNEWMGYSVGEINELLAAVAKANKAAVTKIDLSGAPDTPRYG